MEEVGNNSCERYSAPDSVSIASVGIVIGRYKERLAFLLSSRRCVNKERRDVLVVFSWCC